MVALYKILVSSGGQFRALTFCKSVRFYSHNAKLKKKKIVSTKTIKRYNKNSTM